MYMTKLKAIGLTETTTPRQKANGTRSFHDPITNCDYISYASGYVRRAYTSKSYWTGGDRRTIYQLNKTRKVTSTVDWSSRTFESTERIMIPSETDRLERLAHCAITYRNTNSK